MALPELLVPPSLPPFVLPTSHTRATVYADAQVGTGHARRRRMRTVAPRRQTVCWILSREQMQIADAWFEDSLRAGSEKFSVQIPSPGVRVVWWEAQWVAPWLAEPIAGNGYWRVTGELLFTGEPSQTAPVSTSAEVEFGMALLATAEAAQFAYGEVEFGMVLRTVQLAEVEFSMALESIPVTYELRDDDTYELRDDDTFELRDEDA